MCVYESMSDYGAMDLKGWISADEVQEPRLLQEEINKLREENHSLREKLTSLQSLANREADATSDDGLFKILKAIEIKIPASVTGGKEATRDLLTIAYASRDTLINGVTNAFNVLIRSFLVF